MIAPSVSTTGTGNLGSAIFLFSARSNNYSVTYSAGEYNAEVQKYKQQVERLEYQQRILSAKLYHNHMVKHALEAKRKMGLKVDDGVIDFYRTQPDDADLQEKRRLERARAAMAKQLDARKHDKQLSSILAAAVQLAAKQEAEGASHTSSSYRFTHALAEIGVQLPPKLQIGLPSGYDEVYLSEDDARSDDTASVAGSEPDGDLDDLLDELDAANADASRKNPRKGSKKRKRDDSNGAPGDNAMDTDHAPSGSAADQGDKRKSWKERRKFLPPLPYEESFSIFPTIRSFLLSLNASPSATPGATLAEISSHIGGIAKLVSQVPFGLSLPQFVHLCISTLLAAPSSLGFNLQAHKTQAGSGQDESAGVLTSGATSVPFLKRSDGKLLGATKLDSPDLRFLWNLPYGHAQNDYLESLETLFFFAATRFYISNDKTHIDWEQTRTAKATLTLPEAPKNAVLEFRAQEANRFLSPDQPFAYTCAHPQPGHSTKYIAMPNPRTHAPGRKGALLSADRPDVVSSASLMRDALARLPGGIGTRLDVASLVLQSQYLASEITDASQVAQPVASAFDRIQLEYDPSVRYDADLRLYVYTHRQRSEADFIAANQRIERIKKGDTGELWAAVHSMSGSAQQPPLATLNSFLSGEASRM